MSDTVEQIKSRLDIVDVISGYLKVQKAGINHKARCPFHNEKTPSFYISPERQSWHCFGCNKGGDMFSFVQEIEGVEFVEAMRILAAKAGVQIPEYRGGQTAPRDQKAPFLAVAELSAKFFEKQLWHSNAGAKALAYLRGRGLTDDTIKVWRLGWAPNDWRALTGFLAEAGHQSAAIVAAGMAIDKNGRPYDRFRSRIMFPINDVNGHVAGFTGRVFGAQVAVGGEEPAKYVNTPQTAIYDKSRIIFGLDKAKMDIRKHNGCLLVEGNMDAIMSHQAGAAHAVATSGTALTPSQLRMLSRYSTNLDFCFDTDAAGQTATRRGIGLALSQNFTVNVLTIDDTECKDPADYVAKYGEKWNAVAASAKPVLQYYYDTAVAGYDPRSAASKKAVITSMGPFVKRLASKVEQSHWVSQLASLLRADDASVKADIANVRDDITAYERADTTDETPKAENEKPEIPLDPHNRELLGMVARFPALLADAQAVDQALLDPRVAVLLKEPDALKSGAEHEHKHLVDEAYLIADRMWEDWEPEQLKAELAAIGNRLYIRRLKDENRKLQMEIQQTEQEKDTVKRDELVRRLQQNHRELNQRTGNS